MKSLDNLKLRVFNRKVVIIHKAGNSRVFPGRGKELLSFNTEFVGVEEKGMLAPQTILQKPEIVVTLEMVPLG